MDTRSASAAVTNPTVKLAMDHTQLASGQTYYTVNGAITVKITPASGASEVTVP